MRKRALSSAIAIAASITLAACGGGGGSGGGGTPIGGGPAPTPSPTAAPPVAVCNSAKTLCFPTAQPSAVSEAPAKPKVILLVMLDDADYNDVGYFSSDAVTPHIDSIANSGVRLSRYYAGAPICSPSRAAMLTGQSSLRYGLNYLWGNRAEGTIGDYYFGQRGLPEEDGTLAEGLREEGYRTFFVGKWHLGTAKPGFLPGGQGFDKFSVQIGNYAASGSVREFTEKGNFHTKTEWWSKRAADQIIANIDEGLASGDNIFINWWPVEPHTAYGENGQFLYVPPTFDQAAFERDAGSKSVNLSTDRGKLVSMMYAFDAQLGRVVEHIKQKNLYDDALIIVTSDNGGVGHALSPSHELLQHKGTMFEGGLRVPFAASWPRRFAPGTHTSGMMSAFDVYPTLMGLIGGRLPSGIVGQNMASLLLNGTGTRGPLFYETRRVLNRRSDERYFDTMALIDGCDKFVIWSNVEYLHDVCADPLEKKNLASSNSSRLSAMRAKLREMCVQSSLYTRVPSLGAASLLPASERLNIHHDGMSLYATINPGSGGSGSFNILRRGDGIDVRMENGRVVATITGVADVTRNPPYRIVSLDAPVPADGKAHRIGLVVRGYTEAGSTISLYVDGQLKSRLAAPIDVLQDAGTSVMAVKDETIAAQIGADGLSITDLLLLTNSIEPDEF